MIYKFILFHRHTLRQISRHIHIQSLIHSHIVSKQLQRNHAQQRNQRIQGSWNLQYIIRNLLHLLVTLSHHGKDAAVSRLHLLHVRDNLFIQLMMRSKENDWHILIYQSDRPMLHFGSRITLSIDVTDFLQLQRTFHSHRIVYATSQVQEVVRIGKHSRDILDHRILLQLLRILLPQSLNTLKAKPQQCLPGSKGIQLLLVYISNNITHIILSTKAASQESEKSSYIIHSTIIPYQITSRISPILMHF